MINSFRLSAALAAGKAAGVASRLFRGGGGTTIPGVVARRIAPDTLRQLSARLPQGVIVVGGTNGKTTTTRMIAAILHADGRQVLHNRAGANLLTGLTSTALAGASLLGRLQADTGLFETDEAALPDALAETQPRLVVLHNLFRDQLDRYGEVDTIASRWRGALQQLPATSTVLLNADDPAIADLGAGLQAQVRYYGLEDTRHASSATAHIADSQFCQRCGTPYVYDPLFYAHIGHYACPNCGHRRPVPEYRLERLDLDGTTGSRLLLTYPGGALEIRLPLPGLYNATNALAAAAAALLLGVPPARVRDTLEHFSAAFGRIERINADGKPLFMALIKNPVGASETVRMLTQSAGDLDNSKLKPQTSELYLLIAINDRYADGTDVSWLWDADFEQLGGRVAHAVVSGTRAADMAVRLKYAGVEPARVQTEPDLARALDTALKQLPNGATLYALPTYTAMLELREELVRRGWVRPFWED
ncbi:MAG TPA: MurT ligase domain-containing protein [Roseiflexaceae bacterium]|jgi:UDP-N-acetylmuramyl tripeptide synthase|nr:MurT ligase domain-containing protein [Roseiflexaceae bacterium]